MAPFTMAMAARQGTPIERAELSAFTPYQPTIPTTVIAHGHDSIKYEREREREYKYNSTHRTKDYHPQFPKLMYLFSHKLLPATSGSF